MYVYSLFNILVIFELFGAFLIVSFFPLSLLFTLVMSMALKCKSIPSQNPLHSGVSSSSDPIPFHLRFHDENAQRTSRRTFLDEVFIRNAESFWRTSPTLTYRMSFTVGVGSHYVTSRSHVHPCWFKIFTLTCMDLILQYLSFILAFEVRALLSHRSLYPMCSVFRG